MYQLVCMKTNNVAEDAWLSFVRGWPLRPNKEAMPPLDPPARNPRALRQVRMTRAGLGVCFERIRSRVFCGEDQRETNPQAPNSLPYITRRHIQQRIDDCGRQVAAALAASGHDPGHVLELHDELF